MINDADSLEIALRCKIDVLVKANPWLDPRLLDEQLASIVIENSSFRVRSAKFIGVANQFVEALKEHVPCRRGCDQCCHMATPIFLHEADKIAMISGEKMSYVPHRPHADVINMGAKFYGKPCPFLSKNLCTVYEARPLICRIHHSLNSSASECDTSTPLQLKTGVGMFNPDHFELPYIELTLRKNRYEPWGYIQEFFPKRRGST